MLYDLLQFIIYYVTIFRITDKVFEMNNWGEPNYQCSVDKCK